MTYSKISAVAIGASIVLALGACSTTDEPSESATPAMTGEALSGNVVIDGSSTVAPLTEVAAELFQGEYSDVRISVGVSGTGGGFEKFCNGETDISEASRPIKDEEGERCAEAGIGYVQLGLANDGLAVVVNPENDWAQCLTVDEVSSMWRPEDPATSWAQVRDGFPDEPITAYGPGSDSGTFDFFTDEINGESGAIRADYNDIGEDDNAAVLGVAGSTGATAFIPLSFVNEAGDQVKAIEIVNDEGNCVAPALETVLTGEYAPLGRQLFLYPSDAAVQRPEVLAFLEYYINNQAEIAEIAGFIPLNDEQEVEALARLEELLG